MKRYSIETIAKVIKAKPVLLDQNVSIRRLANALFDDGFRVVRALAHTSIPDDEIRSEADRLNAMVITMDKGFEPHPGSLILLPKKGIKQRIIA